MNTATENTKEAVIVNGVNVTALGDVLEAVKGEPKIAKFQFRAKNKWINGGHNRSTIQGYYGACEEQTSREEPFVFDNGEPPVFDLRTTAIGGIPPRKLLEVENSSMTITTPSSATGSTRGYPSLICCRHGFQAPHICSAKPHQ
jgi:hypothetical protein